MQITPLSCFETSYNQLHFMDISSRKKNKEMKSLSRDNDILALFNKILEETKEKCTKVWPHKFICKEGGFNHMNILSNCLCDAVASSVKLSLTDYMLYDLEPNCFLHFTKSFGLGFTRLSKLLEQIVLVLVNLLLICMLKVTIMLFIVTLWCNVLMWRNCGSHFRRYLIHLVTKRVYHRSLWDHGSLNDSRNIECVEAVTHDVQQMLSTEICDVYRSIGKEQAKKQMDKNLHESNRGNTENSGLLGSNNNSLATSKVTTKHLPPALETESKSDLSLQTTGYTTNKLPGATVSHDQHYETNFDEDTPPISKEETRKNVRPVPKEKDVDSLLYSYQNAKKTSTELRDTSQPHVQDTTKSPSKTVPSSGVNKSHKSLPRRACLVHHKEQYHLDNNLLSQPRATKYLVKVRTEISPGRYMAKLELQCSSKDDRLPNLDATQQGTDTENKEEDIAPTRERKHFPSNISKTGYAIFSSNLDCFSGSIQYPLPNKKAVASRIGYGGNAVVFVVFHAGKEFAVKKTVYRTKEISVHSQLCHPNIINLEAVLIGEKHERHKDKYYVYCFMPKMDINFRNVLSTKEHGCLKHMKMQLLEKREQWEVVLVNVKHVLRSVLKAMDYMHSQGLVHRDIKASNILIKMTCQCTDVLYCNCQRRKFIVQIGDFDSSATVPGYQLQLEEHQMIRYASVLPLGTMGYRAPEVSMHLVLSGPYEILYTTGVDIWSFGCLLLTIFIGKSGPLKQRGEASLLLSAQDHPYSQELYQNVIKIKEIQKYYANTSGVCDLVHKCLQVQPHCRPTAKELLQLDFFTS